MADFEKIILPEGFIFIKGYEGLYAINRKGHIFGLKSNRILLGSKNYKSSRVHHLIGLYDGGGNRSMTRISKLVMEHFSCNLTKDKYIHHIDRNPENNNIENLITKDKNKISKLIATKVCYLPTKEIFESINECHKKLGFTYRRIKRHLNNCFKYNKEILFQFVE